MTPDPTKLQSLAISADDLVAAVEARAQGSDTVLRVTPPFSGRMRARIHVVQPHDSAEETLHVDPTELLTEDAPTYPTADETEDEFRAAVDEPYTVERHRSWHEEQIAEWRAAIPSYTVDSIAPAPVGHEVTIALLGP